jgi:FKBP-type peptidyl-prolyl cis-trans isomerase FklB
MKPFLSAAIGIGLVAGAWAADDPLGPPTTERDRVNYSLGYQIGGDFRQQGVEVRAEAVARGIADALAGESPLMTPEEMRRVLTGLKRKILAQQGIDAHKLAQKALDEGRRFLEQNAKQEGVVTLGSGLQYRVLRPGSGRQPGPLDRVSVQYRAALIDGVEFDSTYAEGEPVEVGVDEVMPGWREGLQLMQEGAQWRLFVPANLGYGERGPLADRAVILEVELLKVLSNDGQTAAPPSGGDQK